MKIKKQLFLAIAATMMMLNVSAQETTQRSVKLSDLSAAYRRAVSEQYYQTLGSSNSGLESGYHGFLDFGYTFGVGDYHLGMAEVNTTHGYQFNPFLFVGAGLGFHYIGEYSTPYMDIALDYRARRLDIPFYADVRCTFMNEKITPFFDAKVGYYVTHRGGLYADLSLGCRFYIYDSQAISLSVGYTRQELEFDTYRGYDYPYDRGSNRYPKKLGTNGISVKIGYDF